MTIASRESGVRGIAGALDRAIGDAVRRWPIVIVFILVEAIGGTVSELLPDGFNVAVIVIGSLLENRCRVVASQSLIVGRGIAWRAVFSHPAALWMAVVGAISPVPGILAMTMVAVPLAFRTAPAYGFVRATFLILFALAFDVIVAVLLAAVLLVYVASVAALIDVVQTGSSMKASFNTWLKRCFRKRTLGSTLLAAIIFELLYLAVTVLWSFIPPRNGWMHAIIVAIPDGLGDAIAFFFVWHWRIWRLDIDHGRDISQALLDVPNVAVSI